MSNLDEITALVIGVDETLGERPSSLFGLQEDMRLSKAAALYADRVALASFPAAYTMVGVTGDPLYGLPQTKEALTPEVRDTLRADFQERFLANATPQEERALEDLAVGLQRGAFWLPSFLESGFIAGAWMAGRSSARVLPLYGERTLASLPKISQAVAAHTMGPQGEKLLSMIEAIAEEAPSEQTRAKFRAMADQVREERAGRRHPPEVTPLATAESQLVTGVLGGLRVFPQAEWDVILDVRKQLSRSRARLRSVIAEAAEELQNASQDELVHACTSLRRRLVDPAVAEIDEELEDLGAVSSLLRFTQDPSTVGTVAANLALVASDVASLGLGTLAHGVASAPLVASAAREAAHQRSKRRSLAAQPYWVLRELARRSSQ